MVTQLTRIRLFPSEPLQLCTGPGHRSWLSQGSHFRPSPLHPAMCTHIHTHRVSGITDRQTEYCIPDTLSVYVHVYTYTHTQSIRNTILCYLALSQWPILAISLSLSLLTILPFRQSLYQREHQVYNTCVYFAISPHFGVSIPISFL